MEESSHRPDEARTTAPVAVTSGGIAHDLNNLFTVIVGNAEFLAEQLKAQPKLQRLANDIAAAGDRGTGLAQRLLEALIADGHISPSIAALVEQYRETLRITGDIPPSQD